MEKICLSSFPTPYFLVDEQRLRNNLAVLQSVCSRTGCKILLAQKAFSMYSTYPIIREYLTGTTASGLYEAKLGHDYFGGETHVFSPAYREQEFCELLKVADDFVFNSPTQLKKYGQRAKDAGKSVGLRVNPECSTQEGHAIYDPCAPGSRLGTTLANFDESLLPLLDGLHFHTLCEQNSDDLKTTAAAFEEKFGKYLHGLKWINFGGGHHITRSDYDIETLVSVIEHFRDTYGVQVYLEPGEAVVYHAGFIVTSVLEMPYRPPLKDSGEAGEKAYTYRLGGPTCLAGDIIGDYSFDAPLKEGDKLVFEDMALYTMVKTNTFNGMPLPSIVWRDKDGQGWLVRQFGYSDFLSRL